MTSPPNFPQFVLLPIEIRQKIWNYTLPGPRVMLVTRSDDRPGKYVTSNASYGGHHPSALHVNAESRAQALMTLTPLFGAYWNLQIDAPYIEATDYSQLSNTQLAEMRLKGVLKDFKHLAIDWTIWGWIIGSDTMEFKCTFRDGRFDSYEHPLNTLAALPNLKTCTFIHTKHTLQKSLIEPYVPWTIGPMDAVHTLDEDWERVARSASLDIDQKIEALSKAHTNKILVHDPYTNWAVVNEEVDAINVPGGLEISLAAIHDRKREILPPDELYRQQAGWEMDWFG